MPVDHFATVASDYLAWAERADVPSEKDDARELLSILLRVWQAALELPDGEAPDEDIESTSHEEWSSIYARCANLPIDIYWEIFNPLTEEAEDPVAGSLSDDLADIHRDLKRGMGLYKAGRHDAAAWEWQLHFRAHWGHHLSAALYALQAWYAEEYFARG